LRAKLTEASTKRSRTIRKIRKNPLTAEFWGYCGYCDSLRGPPPRCSPLRIIHPFMDASTHARYRRSVQTT
jgi:hypothetical protein